MQMDMNCLHKAVCSMAAGRSTIALRAVLMDMLCVVLHAPGVSCFAGASS
jgi:hypothetical protein